MQAGGIEAADGARMASFAYGLLGSELEYIIKIHQLEWMCLEEFPCTVIDHASKIPQTTFGN